MPLARHDLDVARSAAATTLVLVGVAWALLVVAGDDAPGAGARLARWAAIAPGAGGLAVAWGLSRASERGETRALAALGASPFRIAAPWVLGAAVVGVGAALLVATSVVDPAGLLPRLAQSGWRVADAAFTNATLGLRVGASGAPEVVAAIASDASRVEPWTRVGIVVALALAALAVPAWTAAPLGAARRVVSVAVAFVVAVAAFHAVAAGVVSAAALAVAPLLLAVDSYLAYTRARL